VFLFGALFLSFFFCHGGAYLWSFCFAEFLVQMQGVGHGKDEQVLVLAATNIPWGLDSGVPTFLSHKHVCTRLLMATNG
jgi:hypothetical protein